MGIEPLALERLALIVGGGLGLWVVWVVVSTLKLIDRGLL